MSNRCSHHCLPADHWPKDAQGGGVPPGSPHPRSSFRRAETWRANDPRSQGAPVPRPLLRQQKNLVSTLGLFFFFCWTLCRVMFLSSWKHRAPHWVPTVLNVRGANICWHLSPSFYYDPNLFCKQKTMSLMCLGVDSCLTKLQKLQSRAAWAEKHKATERSAEMGQAWFMRTAEGGKDA